MQFTIRVIDQTIGPTSGTQTAGKRDTVRKPIHCAVCTVLVIPQQRSPLGPQALARKKFTRKSTAAKFTTSRFPVLRSLNLSSSQPPTLPPPSPTPFNTAIMTGGIGVRDVDVGPP